MLPVGFKKTLIKKKNPLVSVIIPAYNEQTDIGECIKSLNNQKYKNLEIIVIDDGSTDKTIEISRSFPRVRVYKQDHKGPGAAKNLGAKKAKGEVIVFVDADMILFPTYVEKLVRPVLQNKVLGTSETIQYNIQKTRMQECWGTIIGIPKKEGTGTTSVVKAIARDDFLQLGGYDSKYGYADDRTFYLKYGLRFQGLQGPKCYHKTPPTPKGVYKQSRWIGAALENGLLKHGFFRAITPPLMLFSFIFAIPSLSFLKCRRIKNFKLYFPWMLVFMTARYFGTLAGIARRTYLGINVR